MGARPLWKNPTITLTSPFVPLADGGDAVLWPPEPYAPPAPPRPTADELAAEYHRLAAAFPAPTTAEVLADFRWLSDEQETVSLDDYRGQYVAVLDRRVVHFGRDELQVRVEAATEYGVHPGRFAVRFLYPRDGSFLWQFEVDIGVGENGTHPT